MWCLAKQQKMFVLSQSVTLFALGMLKEKAKVFLAKSVFLANKHDYLILPDQIGDFACFSSVLLPLCECYSELLLRVLV